MSVIDEIRVKIFKSFTPTHVDIINESSFHSVPTGSESHLKIVLVSPLFESQNLLARQRAVYDLLKDELKNRIHALSLVLKTPEEWGSQPIISASPPCLGGSKKDQQ